MDDAWVDSHVLIDLAAEHGREITQRTLELWRYRGLLPRPQRRPGGRAVWLYPPSTARQLLRLLHWRERSKTLDEVRVALWVEGFAIELETVRKALGEVVDAATSAFRRELGPAESRSSTIDLLARKLAAMRSRAPIPRVVRMRSGERARAYGYMLALVSGDRAELEQRKDDAMLLDRMLGLRSGHGSGLAELSPLTGELVQALPGISAKEVQHVIGSASEEEYEFVRLLARSLLLWVPMLLPLMRSSPGREGCRDARCRTDPVPRTTRWDPRGIGHRHAHVATHQRLPSGGDPRTDARPKCGLNRYRDALVNSRRDATRNCRPVAVKQM